MKLKKKSMSERQILRDGLVFVSLVLVTMSHKGNSHAEAFLAQASNSQH